MEEIKIDDKIYKYKIIKDDSNAFNKEELENKITDYFIPFDYILGDYAGKNLRLKGFNKKGNKHFNKYNDYSKIDEYIKNYCNYNSKYFLLEKESNN